MSGAQAAIFGVDGVDGDIFSDVRVTTIFSWDTELKQPMAGN